MSCFSSARFPGRIWAMTAIWRFLIMVSSLSTSVCSSETSVGFGVCHDFGYGQSASLPSASMSLSRRGFAIAWICGRPDAGRRCTCETAPMIVVGIDGSALRQGAFDAARQEIVEVLGADRASTIDIVTREGNARGGAARGISPGRVARCRVARSWRVHGASAWIGQPAVHGSRRVPGGRRARSPPRGLTSHAAWLRFTSGFNR